MKLELLDQRVLGAVRLLDATTGLPLRTMAKIQGIGIKFFRNSSGYYVIEQLAGNDSLQAHTTEFVQPPDTPAIGSVTLTLNIIPLDRQYLSRRYSLKLPRDPNPLNAKQENSLFKTVDIKLFRAAIAPTSATWGVLRATVKQKDTNHRLPWALIWVRRNSDSQVIAQSLADWRGEVLIAVPGIPAMNWVEGSGPVLTSEIDVSLEVIFDPAIQKIPDTADLSNLIDPNQGYLPNPDDLEGKQKGNLAYKLAAGRDRSDTLLVKLT